MNVPATPVEMAAHVKTRTTSTVVNVQQVSTVSTVKQVRIMYNVMLRMGLVLRSLNLFILEKIVVLFLLLLIVTVVLKVATAAATTATTAVLLAAAGCLRLIDRYISICFIIILLFEVDATLSLVVVELEETVSIPLKQCFFSR